MRLGTLLLGLLILPCGCGSIIRIGGDVHELVGSQSEGISAVWIDEVHESHPAGVLCPLGGALIRLCHGADFALGATARGRCEQFYANELGQFEQAFRTRSRVGDQCVIIIEHDGMTAGTGVFLYEGHDRHDVRAVLVRKATTEE
jgi:hypothetical protein